ncbi:MAG: hypothetical protein JNN21_13940 [Candidatus Accumulibacter sp.]|uniref:hypothetical protein n=1 Tax=Accumulibacter sp. TaxID=2053492 RepID=UPI001A583684|nr:hypothetical protein [Accumulibacter sp.]MBL8392954.1 hypothetical protein [Accumulibacter sp.]
MQVEYHLAKAQAAAATHGAGARTLLAPAIAGRLRTMRRIDAERPFEWLVGVMPEALAFRGEVQDFQDLQEMLGNLLDNACTWSTKRVELAASPLHGLCVALSLPAAVWARDLPALDPVFWRRSFMVLNSP